MSTGCFVSSEGALPGHVHVAGIRNRDDPDNSGAIGKAVALRGGLVGRVQSPGNVGRAAGDVQDDFAAQAESREVVVVQFRHGERVSGEHHGRFDGGRRIDAAADDGILSES